VRRKLSEQDCASHVKAAVHPSGGQRPPRHGSTHRSRGPAEGRRAAAGRPRQKTGGSKIETAKPAEWHSASFKKNTTKHREQANDTSCMQGQSHTTRSRAKQTEDCRHTGHTHKAAKHNNAVSLTTSSTRSRADGPLARPATPTTHPPQRRTSDQQELERLDRKLSGPRTRHCRAGSPPPPLG